MSDKIQRSDTRESEYGKYADAILSQKGRTMADLFGPARPAAYQRGDANALPTFTSGLINLSEIGPRQRQANDTSNQFRHLAAQEIHQEAMQERAIRRRLAAGLPVEESFQQEEVQDDAASENEVVASIEAMLPAIARRAGANMNRTAQRTVSALVQMLDLPQGQKEWFLARIEEGVDNPNIFRRDLRMAISSKEVL